jgi:hypothetical protein
MGTDNSSDEMREITPVDAESFVKHSRYDTALPIDTTPTSRVEWITDGASEPRSAFDANMIVDTTPTARPEPAAPSHGGTDSGSASNDQ